MSDVPENLRDVDWSTTTFEGARREQLKRWREMTLEEVVAALEGMGELAGFPSRGRDDASLTNKEQ